MEPAAKTCVKCGAPIEDPASTGRPRIYCTRACQRAAGHEVRRINVLLEKLETQASHARLGYGSEPAKRIKNLEGEIARQEARLRDLLGDLGDDDE